MLNEQFIKDMDIKSIGVVRKLIRTGTNVYILPFTVIWTRFDLEPFNDEGFTSSSAVEFSWFSSPTTISTGILQMEDVAIVWSEGKFVDVAARA